MAETQILNDRSDFDHLDLEELPRRYPESRLRTVFITAAVIVFVLAFAVFMIRGSMPELTPEQIVQMKGYEGQQAPRQIFNLYSLRKYQEQNAEAKLTATANRTSLSAGSSDSIIEPDGDSTSQSGHADTTVVQTTVESESREAGSTKREQEVIVAASNRGAVPRVTIISDKHGEASTAMPVKLPANSKTKTESVTNKPAARTYEKAELKRQGELPVLATGSSRSDSENRQKAEVLPVGVVKGDQTRLRSGPSRNSDILLLLAKGDSITIFDTVGEWTHVGANDGSSTMGYVHNSLLDNSAEQ